MISTPSLDPIKAAWREIYQLRTCPPRSVRTDPAQIENIRRHEKGCVFCARYQNDNQESWAELGKHLAHFFPQPEHPMKAPGQIWALKENKGGWDERYRHINPPQVLILEKLEDLQAVRVAQVFDQKALAGEDDIPLGENLPWAEPWNTYALDMDDLDFCLATTSEKKVHAVMQAVEQKTSSLDENSTLWFFRQLELEIGSLMALETLDKLLNRHEKIILQKKMNDSRKIKAKISAFDKRILLPEKKDILKTLALARLPKDRLPLAAADEEILPYNIFHPCDDQTIIAAAQAKIYRREMDEKTIRITAELDPKNAAGSFFAWWKTGSVLREGKIMLDPCGGSFIHLEFSGCSKNDFSSGRAILLLIAEDYERD